MESIGERLRTLRKEKKLTLEDVSTRTRIAKRYLEALEEDRYQMLPDETYITSFLRSYATYLGMDVTEAIRIYRQEKPESNEAEDKLWTDASEPEPEKKSRWLAIGAAAAAVVAVAVYYFFIRR